MFSFLLKNWDRQTRQTWEHERFKSSNHFPRLPAKGVTPNRVREDGTAARHMVARKDNCWRTGAVFDIVGCFLRFVFACEASLSF